MTTPRNAPHAANGKNSYWHKIVLPATREKPRRQEASAVPLRDGGLLVLWSDFDGRSDNARATIEAAVSHDRGNQIEHPAKPADHR